MHILCAHTNEERKTLRRCRQYSITEATTEQQRDTQMMSKKNFEQKANLYDTLRKMMYIYQYHV